jgi:hypothetical protein
MWADFLILREYESIGWELDDLSWGEGSAGVFRICFDSYTLVLIHKYHFFRIE